MLATKKASDRKTGMLFVISDSVLLPKRISRHVDMGKTDSACYAIAVNESLVYLTATNAWLSSEHSNGIFGYNRDDGVISVALDSSKALRGYTESESGEDNLKTARRLETLVSEYRAMLRRGDPVYNFRRIVTLEDMDAHMNKGRYDLVVNDALVYHVLKYTQLRSASSARNGIVRGVEFSMAADIVATALEELSFTENGILIRHDKESAREIGLFGA